MGTYLIIGGTSGIGYQIATQLLAEGHEVYATYKDSSPPQTGATYLRHDVLTDELSLPELEVLDGLVYCPGSIDLKPFHRIKPESFVDDYKLQVVGAVKSIQTALPYLKKSNQASIILFSTVAVQRGYTFHSQVAASKGAIEGLTRSLAAEFAPTIRVNAIAPSITDTPLAAKLLSSDEKKAANAARHPLNAIGEPEDISQIAGFLLSPKSKWITGQVVHVDGGISTLNK